MIRLLLIVMFCASACSALTYTDNFDRANEDPLAGDWATPTGADHGVVLVNNRVTGASSSISAARWKAVSIHKDQFSQAVVKDVGTNLAPAVRMASGSMTFYYFKTNNTLYRSVSGSSTSLGTCTHTWANNDTIKISVRNDSVYAWINGTIAIRKRDTIITSGQPGLRIYGNTDTLDEWSGGDTTIGPFSYATSPKLCTLCVYMSQNVTATSYPDSFTLKSAIPLWLNIHKTGGSIGQLYGTPDSLFQRAAIWVYSWLGGAVYDSAADTISVTDTAVSNYRLYQGFNAGTHGDTLTTAYLDSGGSATGWTRSSLHRSFVDSTQKATLPFGALVGGKFYGATSSRSCRQNHAVDGDAYSSFAYTTASESLSVGFYYRTTIAYTGYGEYTFVTAGRGGSARCVFGIQNNASDSHQVVLETGGDSTAIKTGSGIDNNTWYWISMQCNRAKKRGYLALYDSSLSLIGSISESLYTATPGAFNLLNIGKVGGSALAVDSNSWFDEVFLDTTGVFPLIPKQPTPKLTTLKHPMGRVAYVDTIVGSRFYPCGGRASLDGTTVTISHQSSDTLIWPVPSKSRGTYNWVFTNLSGLKDTVQFRVLVPSITVITP